MKIYRKLSALLMVAAIAMSTVTFTACNDDNDEFGTNQYIGGIHLNVYGPSPVARGGELRFLGSGMSQITSIEIPGCDPITDIKVVSDEEIRCAVPQTAQPGLLVLKHANGSITTKTPLTYTEPISIESFAPATVKAGETLTIKGEYLNLIREVIFPKDVVVPETDFLAHSRSEIKVVVPVEAQTGKFIISDGAEEMPNWIYSDVELNVVLPSVDAPADLTDKKPGDVVTIKGNDFDLITGILLPTGDNADFEYSEGAVTFTLPENICNGVVYAQTASGVNVTIANIGVVVPVISSVTPSTELRAGDIITIKGANIDQVVNVTFPNVGSPVELKEVATDYLKVVFPEGAQSGIIGLNLKSGAVVADVELVTAKPEVLGFNPNPVAAATEFTMTGKNLDLITKVTFGGNITVEVTPAVADQLTLTAPATAESARLVLTMANGETVETDELKIDAPACAFVTEVITEELLGGELLVVKVNNGDKLTDVQVNGASVQYIINNGVLYIALPQTAGKDTVVTLISSNGEISYTYDVTPATHIENVIWAGVFECSGWNGNQDLAWGGYDWASVPVGAHLNIHLTPTVAEGEWWCISLRHGDGWGNIPSLPGQYDMPSSPLEVELTAEVLDDLNKNFGLVLTGTGYIMTKITISWEISLEVTLWEGEAIADNWSDQPYMLSDKGIELEEAGAKPGQTIYFYLTPLDSDWKLEILEGHWGPSYGAWCATGSDTENGKFTEWDLASNGGRISLTITQDMLDKAYTQQWWGGVFVLNGDNVKCTKITLE